ncbi:MAG: hypothetical protein ABI305_10595 [Tepidiformaceae bacterium]
MLDAEPRGSLAQSSPTKDYNFGVELGIAIVVAHRPAAGGWAG